jgi:thioredoxin-like negative regulator of GroEL
MSKFRLLPIVVLLAFGVGCEAILGVSDTPEITKEADVLAKSGSLPEAHAKYSEIQQSNPTSVYAAMGLAYSHVLRGEYDQAEQLLASVDTDQVEPPELAQKLRLRRTLIAAKKGDLDGVNGVIKLGEASGSPVGKLLAGEGHIANGNNNQAIPLLEDAASAGGTVGDTASMYLEYIRSDNPALKYLAEANALWSNGETEAACETAKDAVPNLDEDFPSRNEIALLWAGRAATRGKIETAEELLESISIAPEGQGWRIGATKALIMFRKKEYDAGVNMFVQLASGGAPQDGLADAIATAAAICEDAEIAKQITTGLESNATARGLLEAGDRDGAAQLAPSGHFKKFLESGG